MGKKIKLSIIAAVFFIFYTGISVKAIEDDDDELFKTVEIKNGSTLSITECVSASLKNNPKIKKKKYYLDVAKSNVGVAKAQYFPVINAGLGFYNENNSDNIYYNSHYRELPSVGLSINKLIWNFGKTTSLIKIEEFYKIGAEYEFIDCICSVLFDVKAKYYNLLKAKYLYENAKTNVELSKNIVEISTEKTDLTNAKTNLAKAEEELYEREKDYINAKIDLNNAMYFTENIDFDIKSTPTFPYENDFSKDTTASKIKNYTPQVFNFKIEKAAEIAFNNSPDLQVLIASKNAMKESLSYIKKTYLPDLTGTAGYGFNKIIPTSNNSLKVGVNLNSSINIAELRHNIKGADAQIKIADEEITNFKQDLFFEVKRAFNNTEKSQQKIEKTLEEAENARNTYNNVLSDYKSKKLDYLNLQNAKADYINAVNNYITSLYDYNTALIQTEMAMHYHIVDIHHKSEHAVHYHSEELIEHLNKVLDCDEKDGKKH